MLVVLGEGVVEFVNLWWVCTKHFRATYVMRERSVVLVCPDIIATLKWNVVARNL